MLPVNCRLPIVHFLLLVGLSTIGAAQVTNVADNKSAAAPPANLDALGSAQSLLEQGKFSEASAAFKVIADKEPTSVPAQVGLMRSLLRARLFDQALDVGSKAVAALPNSALAHATFGDVNFSAGQMPEAEQEYRAAMVHDPKSSRGLLGMGRLYTMVSMNKHAREAFAQAHELDPNDREIFYEWVDTLPRSQRAEAYRKGIEKFPSRKEHDNRLEALKVYEAEATKKPWELAGQPKPIKIDLQPYGREERFIDTGSRVGTTPISKGYALSVKFNDRATATLLMDSGAAGISIGNKLAQRAGAVKIADSSYSGIGDGSTDSYLAWIDKIVIGGVEFHNCIVDVSTKNSIGSETGLIGTNVFQDYLITLDFQERKMLLVPLPKHPDATGAEDEVLDRYIAPEMQSFAKFYNFDDHMLLQAVLGTAKKNASGLFMLDTGADSNTISVDLARRLTKVNFEEGVIEGVSAKIKQVFSGDKIYLHFAGIHVLSNDITAFDHSSIFMGAEISGLIGITTLVQTKMTIDYRDGLVKIEPYETRPL